MTNRVTLKRIIIELEDGTQSELDIAKVELVNRVTKKPLFNVTIEAEA